MDIKKHKEYLQQGLDYYKRRLETLHDSKADTAAEKAQKELRRRLYRTICNICENSLSFVDSLMPDCEDLDEAAKKCAISKGFAQNTDGGYRYNPIFLEFFKAGALWQKEQMMSKAVDALVHTFDNGYIRVGTQLLDNNQYGLKVGDKVKVLIIKDE